MRTLVWFAAWGALAVAACSDPFALGPATIANRVDTLKLHAVNGTPLTKPSAFLLATKSTYRLGIDVPPYNFDFLYRIGASGTSEFAPFAAVGAGGQVESARSGLRRADAPFGNIDVAEQTGYETSQALPLAVGDVLYVRSSVPNGCFLQIPFYAKLEVLSFDPAERSVRFQILVNNNCGYRGLEPGLPKQ